MIRIHYDGRRWINKETGEVLPPDLQRAAVQYVRLSLRYVMWGYINWVLRGALLVAVVLEVAARL